jgi:hypothetical protein
MTQSPSSAPLLLIMLAVVALAIALVWLFGLTN